MNAQRRNVRTRDFRERFDRLDERIQRLAVAAFELFLHNPAHPSLHHHPLDDTRRGQHRPSSFAVSVTKQYRAIYVVDGETNVWYWIGSHNDYNTFTGRK
jgi:hypothetical protein